MPEDNKEIKMDGESKNVNKFLVDIVTELAHKCNDSLVHVNNFLKEKDRFEDIVNLCYDVYTNLLDISDVPNVPFKLHIGKKYYDCTSESFVEECDLLLSNRLLNALLSQDLSKYSADLKGVLDDSAIAFFKKLNPSYDDSQKNNVPNFANKLKKIGFDDFFKFKDDPVLTKAYNELNIKFLKGSVDPSLFKTGFFDDFKNVCSGLKKESFFNFADYFDELADSLKLVIDDFKVDFKADFNGSYKDVFDSYLNNYEFVCNFLGSVPKHLNFNYLDSSKKKVKFSFYNYSIKVLDCLKNSRDHFFNVAVNCLHPFFFEIGGNKTDDFFKLYEDHISLFFRDFELLSDINFSYALDTKNKELVSDSSDLYFKKYVSVFENYEDPFNFFSCEVAGFKYLDSYLKSFIFSEFKEKFAGSNFNDDVKKNIRDFFDKKFSEGSVKLLDNICATLNCLKDDYFECGVSGNSDSKYFKVFSEFYKFGTFLLESAEGSIEEEKVEALNDSFNDLNDFYNFEINEFDEEEQDSLYSVPLNGSSEVNYYSKLCEYKANVSDCSEFKKSKKLDLTIFYNSKDTIIKNNEEIVGDFQQFFFKKDF